MASNDARDNGLHMASTEEMLQGQLELWHHALGSIKSQALECAIQLRIPDAIVRCGGAATLEDLLATTGVPPSNNPFLRRLMRALTTLRIFALHHRPAGHGEGTDAPATPVPVYELTAASRLLVTGGESSSLSLFPSISYLVDTKTPDSQGFGMQDWIKDERATTMSPLKMMYGKELFEILDTDPPSRARFHDAMAADTRLVMHAVLSESPAIFHGLTSVVDVGGGARGAAATAISKVFPQIKCTVLDLPHVVAEAPKNGPSGVSFVAGDMFKHIPPADAILLKWVLHDWDDNNCVKILRQCKSAITHKDNTGKVIIIDVVIGSRPNDPICMEVQVLCDLLMWEPTNGFEREEHEWRKIFLDAGFRDYKITSNSGFRSVIEVYP